MSEISTKEAFKQESQENREQQYVLSEHESLLYQTKPYCEEDEDELLEMYDTENSFTSSGDSGYGTHRQHQTDRQAAHDLFDSVLTPPASQTSSRRSSKVRLSSLFSTKSRKEPHYVKFQSWLDNQQQQNKKSTIDPYPPPELTIPIAKQKSVTHLDNLELYDDENGHLLAKYKIGNVIGKGHFGTVYRALDLMSGRTVAIKQINLRSSKKQDIEDMMQEARLLSTLTHSNIVKYEGFIKTEEHMNIVLEYVENGSLLNTLKSFGNALPEHLVAGYCQRILRGLIYLHQQHVVHCDLKAANILTTKSGDVKLSDFGVSLNLKLKKDDNTVSGTPFWMSPEVIELKGASIKSDIWSLGCTLIELCTGKPPYSDCIAMTAMFKIVEEPCPPIPKSMSSELRNFLKLCFRKDPLERPSAQELLRHPWIKKHEKALDISSTTSSPSILMKKATSSYPRNLKSRSATLESGSPLAKRAQPKKQSDHLTTIRQSTPAAPQERNKSKKEKHTHDLIDCSFPKGEKKKR
ncbi:kinase-like domain-containing protein [Sporodiniella umbellata]|nr:kinase-like domain-containing protein [Sporodiniella umbellata]